MDNLKQAYKYCEEIIARHSKTFYKAFSMLPKDDRKAVWAVYAFCRTVDDIVDEGADPERELAQFTTEFEQFLSGVNVDNNLIWVALRDVFKRYEMDSEAFQDLIKGQKMDLTISRYDTMDQLLEYCYHVASTVGLMLLPILAPKKIDILKESAISLGFAMQLTNILRDIGEDLDRNRIYLPQEIIRHHKLSDTSICFRKVDASFINVWEHLAKEAESFYEEAFESINEYPMYSRVPVKSAAFFYRQILETIRAKEYNVFNEKHFVTDEAKQAILAQMS